MTAPLAPPHVLLPLLYTCPPNRRRLGACHANLTDKWIFILELDLYILHKRVISHTYVFPFYLPNLPPFRLSPSAPLTAMPTKLQHPRKVHWEAITLLVDDMSLRWGSRSSN